MRDSFVLGRTSKIQSSLKRNCITCCSKFFFYTNILYETILILKGRQRVLEKHKRYILDKCVQTKREYCVLVIISIYLYTLMCL